MTAEKGVTSQRVLSLDDDARSFPDIAESLLAGLDGPDIAVCLADDNDNIRYASDSFRRAFIPEFDGSPVNFAAAIEAAIVAGIGIKLVSKPHGDFTRMVGERRRQQVGALSFATDLVDGSWWWVTDVKLSNGWMMCVAQNISPLKREEFRLRDAHATALEEAQTDHLTGVTSRRHGLQIANALFELAHSTDSALAVALFDIDRFKPINDRYGHEAGDSALVHFARHMVEALGSTDRFSRMGGDEFLLVTPDITAADLEIQLRTVLAALPALRLPSSGVLRLSVSVGVAELAGGDSWPAIMRRADAALYQAKGAGRSRIARAP